jgi:hypothetical protein
VLHPGPGLGTLAAALRGVRSARAA